MAKYQETYIILAKYFIYPVFRGHAYRGTIFQLSFLEKMYLQSRTKISRQTRWKKDWIAQSKIEHQKSFLKHGKVVSGFQLVPQSISKMLCTDNIAIYQCCFDFLTPCVFWPDRWEFPRGQNRKFNIDMGAVGAGSQD